MRDRCLALSGFLSFIPAFPWVKLASNAADRSTEPPQHLPRLFLMSMPLFEQLSTPQIIVLRFVMVSLHQGKVWLKTGHSGYRRPSATNSARLRRRLMGLGYLNWDAEMWLETIEEGHVGLHYVIMWMLNLIPGGNIYSWPWRDDDLDVSWLRWSCQHISSYPNARLTPWNLGLRLRRRAGSRTDGPTDLTNPAEAGWPGGPSRGGRSVSVGG